MKIGKYEWSTTRLICAAATLAAGGVSYTGYCHLKRYLPVQRYPRQLCGLLTGIFVILLVWEIRHLLPPKLKEAMRYAIGSGWQRLSKQTNALLEKLRAMLGIPEPETQRLGGKDETSFLWHRNDAGRRRGNHIEKLKWKDMEDNPMKIRFMYVKFVQKLKKKGIYRYRTTMTPEENRRQSGLKEEEGGFLFDLYTKARFSGGLGAISDHDVEKTVELTK